MKTNAEPSSASDFPKIKPSEYHISKKLNALEFHSKHHEKPVIELLDVLYEADEQEAEEEYERDGRLHRRHAKKRWNKVKAHVNKMSESDPVFKVLWAFKTSKSSRSEDSNDLVASETCSTFLEEMKRNGNLEKYRGLIDILFQSIYLDWSKVSSNDIKNSKRTKWDEIRINVEALTVKDKSFEKAINNFQQFNKSRIARLRRSRRPEHRSGAKRKLAQSKRNDNQDQDENTSSLLSSSEHNKINIYQSSARQRFVHAFFRPWRWGYEILGLPSLRAPSTEIEAVMNKRTIRIMQWRRYCQRQVDSGAAAPPRDFANGDIEFRNLHTYKTYGKILVRTKMIGLVRRRKQFLNLFGSSDRFDQMTLKKQRVYVNILFCFSFSSLSSHLFSTFAFFPLPILIFYDFHFLLQIRIRDQTMAENI